MSSKLNKNKVNRTALFERSIALLLIVLLLLVGLGSTISLISPRDLPISESRKATIINKAAKAIKNYPNVSLVFDVSKMIYDESGEGTETNAEYIIVTSTESTETSYIYRDKETSLNQFWYYDNETESYKVFVYSPDQEVWVYSYLDNPPIQPDTWNMLSNIDTYNLSDEIVAWGDSNCYVFDKVYATDTWDYILEQIYIDSETYLPKGIGLFGTTNSGYVGKPDVIDHDFDNEETEETENFSSGYEVVEYDLYNETYQRYILEWSKEPISIFAKPDDNAISDDTYMNLTYGDAWSEYKSDPAKFQLEHPEYFGKGTGDISE